MLKIRNHLLKNCFAKDKWQGIQAVAVWGMQKWLIVSIAIPLFTEIHKCQEKPLIKGHISELAECSSYFRQESTTFNVEKFRADKVNRLHKDFKTEIEILSPQFSVPTHQELIQNGLKCMAAFPLKPDAKHNGIKTMSCMIPLVHLISISHAITFL